MSPEDKKHTETRISKDADEYVNKHFSGSDYAFLGYIAGAEAEFKRRENEVAELKADIDLLIEQLGQVIKKYIKAVPNQ